MAWTSHPSLQLTTDSADRGKNRLSVTNMRSPDTQRHTVTALSLCLAIVLCGGALFFRQREQLNHKAAQVAPLAPSTLPVAKAAQRSAFQASQDSEPNEIRKLIASPWNVDFFESELLVASNHKENTQSRVLALQKLFSKRTSLSDEQVLQFKQSLTQLAKDKSNNPAVVVAAMRSLVGIMEFLESRGLISKSEIAMECGFLVQYAGDARLDLQIRGTAIRATGDLQLEDSRVLIEAMLRDPANVNIPELARNGALALVKLAQQESFAPIRNIIQNTSDAAVFGTAAFCLGQINTPEAVSVLVGNSLRFADSGSCDAALVGMEKVILETLSHPNHQDVLSAVQATEHLWKDGQQEQYAPKLIGLLADAPPDVKRAACERLLDMAGRLAFAEEKQILKLMLDDVERTPALGDYSERIQRRLSAVVLSPTAATIPVPVQPK